MNKIEQGIPQKKDDVKKDENKLYQEREGFIKEHYPVNESGYDIEDLIASSLDGKEVMEKRDEDGELEAVFTYEINRDNEGTPYCSLGVALTREESRGEGAIKELYEEILEIAKSKGCDYLVAIADTEAGQDILLKSGFYAYTDEVNGREHLRLDLE